MCVCVYIYIYLCLSVFLLQAVTDPDRIPTLKGVGDKTLEKVVLNYYYLLICISGILVYSEEQHCLHTQIYSHYIFPCDLFTKVREILTKGELARVKIYGQGMYLMGG